MSPSKDEKTNKLEMMEQEVDILVRMKNNFYNYI